MPLNLTTAAQALIFRRLNGHLTGCQVFDTAPFLPEGAPASTFPYCVIGEDTFSAWDTDDTRGAQATVTLHFWSRADGFKEVKALMDQAYRRLHRAEMTGSGVWLVDCLYEFGEAMNDPDGVTKHGVQRYRLTMQEP